MKRFVLVLAAVCMLLIGHGKRIEAIGGDAVSQEAPCTLALRIDSVLDGAAEVRVAALNLPKPEATPPADLLNGPFRCYSIPLDGDPHQIGWKNPRGFPLLQTKVVFRGKKYVHERMKEGRCTGRHANGAVSVSRTAERQDVFHVRGVYGWLGQLFVIDAVLAKGEELVLIEPPPTAMRLVFEE